MSNDKIEFLAALNGGKGELDAWLEVNDEVEVRAAIKSAIAAQAQEALQSVPTDLDIIAALDRMDALLDPATDLLSVPSDSATAKASRADMRNIRIALSAARVSAQAQEAPNLGWIVRERRDAEGVLLDCFVEAPKEGNMAYALEVLGDDYTGYGGVERKLEHCKMIVAWTNSRPAPASAQAAVPEGKVLVPMIPTAEIAAAPATRQARESSK